MSESRGRISYLLPDKSKPVTGRRLGTDYDKDYITTRVAENNKLIIKKSEGITPLIDVENNEKAKDSIYYRRALELKNIETLAKMATHRTKCSKPLPRQPHMIYLYQARGKLSFQYKIHGKRRGFMLQNITYSVVKVHILVE